MNTINIDNLDNYKKYPWFSKLKETIFQFPHPLQQEKLISDLKKLDLKFNKNKLTKVIVISLIMIM